MRAARAFYMPEPRAQGGGFSLAAFIGADQAEVWPENWPVFELFTQVQTQWRTGARGPTGLDYAAIYPLLDRVHPADPAAWSDAFGAIRDMEIEALDEIRTQLQNQRPQ